jgi:ATPase family associated with various cellular activities (AAA)
MQKREPNRFEHIPLTAGGHFVLNFYAAVYSLINYIRRLSEKAGEEPVKRFKEFPFLQSYFAEINQSLPPGVTWSQAAAWWESEIADWEKRVDGLLPLRAISRGQGFSFQSRLAFLLVGLVEEDSQFGTLFAALQGPLAFRRPCLETVERILYDEDGAASPMQVCQELLKSGLVEVMNEDAPRSEWVLRVPSRLWNVARGETASHITNWCEYHPGHSLPELKELILPDEFLLKLEQVPALVADGKANAMVLRGMQGSERFQVLGAIAKALGHAVIKVRGSLSAGERHWQHLGPLCSLTRSMPVITYDLGPGETAEMPDLAGYSGPLMIALGFEGGLSGRAVEKAVTLTLPMAKAAHRMRYWREALGSHPVEDLQKICESFHLPGGYIRQAGALAIAHAAMDQREALTLSDIREACRMLNRQLLDTLATRLDVEGCWDHLVVSDATLYKLKELERRCRHREGLMERLGPAFGSGCNKGVRALLMGPSGTGKTFAAKILASELGMDLYRVDLSAIVNKYIGETEKNLNKVLSKAEELDVVLIVDEGDSLLGSRTEVRSSNDRYANLETNFLLQRLESYQGIIVVTTNLADNIDKAFQRRMDIVVSFLPPKAQERWQIWQLHLPSDHKVEADYLEELAIRCEMTGGQIRNASLHAMLLALDDGTGVVRRWHLEGAILSEYRKAGATCPISESYRPTEQSAGMEAFLDALSYDEFSPSRG